MQALDNHAGISSRASHWLVENSRVVVEHVAATGGCVDLPCGAARRADARSARTGPARLLDENEFPAVRRAIVVEGIAEHPVLTLGNETL